MPSTHRFANPLILDIETVSPLSQATTPLMKVDDFDFDLPQSAIAQHSVSPRDSARLLVINGGFQDRVVADLPRLLRSGDLLVLNDTKVIPTRLCRQRGQARVEVTLHKACGERRWLAFARPARRLKLGQRVDFAGGFSADITDMGANGEVSLIFDLSGTALLRALDAHGAMPLPPYIKRQAPDERDRRDYQTLYALNPGAVAAPTAGLHFTEDLLSRLDAGGFERVMLTLHVGAGTFLPVKSHALEGHVMHAERGYLSAAAADAINAARNAGRRVVAVGTTSMRLLEAAADQAGQVRPFAGETDIFITPGYRFRAADALLTNFHLPRSTLFMLVSAFAGLKRMKAAYRYALSRGYRFYSYGDACLLNMEPPR